MKNPFAHHDSPTEEINLAAPTATHRRPKRLLPIIAGVSALAVLGAGGAVAAQSYKTIRLDVDGHVTEVKTWRGSVENLLAEQDITVGSRDIVAPSARSALKDGTDVVVRYARQVTVDDGDDLSHMWTTAVDAEEILSLLEARGEDVRLVASRSAERAEIGIRLPLGEPVSVLADGEVLAVPEATEQVDDALEAADVELGDLDRVSVQRLNSEGEPVTADEDGDVTVVVERVEVKKVKKSKKIAHKSKTVEDSSRFNDLPVLLKTKGVTGKRTITHNVTYVDGVEESREKVSNKVTRKPVTEVLVKGTKVRPVPVVTSEPKASSGDKTSKSKSATKPKSQGAAPSSGVWAALAQCESGGRPNAVSASGAYHGLYQFSVATWNAVGGSGLPSQASAAEQTKRAKILQARSGWGQWPACSAKLGLR